MNLFLTNLARSILTKAMLIFTAKQATKLTSNQIDDNVVAVIEGALTNNPEKTAQAAEKVIEETRKLLQK